MRRLSSVTLFVGSRVKYLFLFKLCGDLARTSALHTQVKDFPNDLCRFLINHPRLWIFGMLLISVRNIDGQTVATLALCLLHGSDFAAGIPRIKLVEPIPDSCKIVVDAVGVDDVVVGH